MFLYVMHADTPVAAGHFEVDPTGQAKLNALKARVLAQHVVYLFKNVDDLGRQVLTDLPKLSLSSPTA
jgi:hypothetical protein